MEIKIKTLSLYSCDLSFHAYLTDFTDITKSSSNAAEISVRCGFEKVLIQHNIKSPILLVLDKTNVQHFVSLVGIFISD